jgi:osmotically-inducible protein OsmY
VEEELVWRGAGTAVQVAVRTGVVSLEGHVPGEDRARDLAEAAEDMDGVVAVRSRLVTRPA